MRGRRCGGATGADHDDVDADFGVVIEGDDGVGPIEAGPDRAAAGADVDAAVTQVAGGEFPDAGVFPVEEPIS